MVILIISFQILSFFVWHMEFARGETLSQFHQSMHVNWQKCFMRYVISNNLYMQQLVKIVKFNSVIEYVQNILLYILIILSNVLQFILLCLSLLLPYS